MYAVCTIIYSSSLFFWLVSVQWTQKAFHRTKKMQCYRIGYTIVSRL